MTIGPVMGFAFFCPMVTNCRRGCLSSCGEGTSRRQIKEGARVPRCVPSDHKRRQPAIPRSKKSQSGLCQSHQRERRNRSWRKVQTLSGVIKVVGTKRRRRVDVTLSEQRTEFILCENVVAVGRDDRVGGKLVALHKERVVGEPVE